MRAKTLLLILALLAFVIPTPAQLALITPVDLGTFNIAATSTNTTIGTSSNLTVIYANRALDVALQVQFKLSGAGTTPVVFKFDASNDLTNWTVAAQSLAITPAGTTTVSKVSNITIGGVPYLRLSQVENPNATIVTNVAIIYSQKQR